MDLGQLREELQIERHSNELKMKHMMSDMEAVMETSNSSEEVKETTYKFMTRVIASTCSPGEVPGE